MKNLPKPCQECEKLKVLSIYIDGSCDYVCGRPQCEYREAYKEAERQEKRRRRFSLDDFIDILFDKEAQEQFFKECEELGIVDKDSKGEDDVYI